MHFKACIFDFDGVVIDSESLHIEASRLTLEHFGIAYPDTYFDDFVGRADIDFFTRVAEQLDASATTVDEMIAFKRRLYDELLTEVRLVPGAELFVRAARHSFDAIGLATSATRREIEVTFRRFAMSSWFDAVVNGEDTFRHKPHPEPYLKILDLLGVEAPAALVIEDSPSGIIAARAAGCVVAGLATSYPAGPLTEAGANMVVSSFRDLGQALGIERM